MPLECNPVAFLSRQISSAGWCCSTDDNEGLWYTALYSPDQFFDHWSMMAERYRGNPLVIGADLRNEPRDTQFDKVTWGSGVKATDWNQAAEEAGKRTPTC